MNTNTEHPKALEAKARAALREVERRGIKRAVAAHGIHFFTLGRYTFCYRVDKRNVLEISSAIRHPNDPQDFHMGRIVAIERFAAGNRMHLRMPNDLKSPRDFLTTMFMHLE